MKTDLRYDGPTIERLALEGRRPVTPAEVLLLAPPHFWGVFADDLLGRGYEGEGWRTAI